MNLAIDYISTVNGIPFFGAEWSDVLDAAEKSFGYNAPNNGYFAVCNLRALETVTLDQVLKEKGIGSPPNVIVS